MSAAVIPTRFAYAAVLVGVFGHASSEFFAVLSGVAGPEVSVWRYLIGGLGLILAGLALSGRAALLAPLRADGPALVLWSLVGVTAAYLAFHWALDFASVVQVATLTTTIPIFIGLANLAANGERPSPVKIATGACAVAGLALLVTDGAVETLAGDARSIWGVFLGLACAAFVAVYAVKVKPIVARHGAIPVTAVSMMIGGIGLWVVVGLFFSVWVNPAELFERPAIAWASLLALALWNTTVTQVLWIGGLAAAPDMTRAGYLFFLKPVIAAGLALVVLGETISALQLAAIVVVMASVGVELAWPRLSGRFAQAR